MEKFPDPVPARPIVEQAFATPFVYDREARAVSGCLYDPEGRKLAISERFGGYRGDHVRTINPERVPPPARIRRVAGRSLYLGHFMGRHYGHFLLESLSAAWPLDELTGIDSYVFHPFIFGTRVAAFARDLLSAAGVDIRRLVFVEETTRFDEIVIPARLFRINHSAHPRLLDVYARIAARYPAPQKAAKGLYLSRARLPRTQRTVANEAEVEALFRARGFDVIHPQEMSIAAQAPLYAACRVFAGFSGSALHNVVFSRPGSTLIHLGDSRAREGPMLTQLICNELANVECHHLPFAEGGRPGYVDVEAIEAGLARLDVTA